MEIPKFQLCAQARSVQITKLSNKDFYASVLPSVHVGSTDDKRFLPDPDKPVEQAMWQEKSRQDYSRELLVEEVRSLPFLPSMTTPRPVPASSVAALSAGGALKDSSPENLL
jgi:hypothetical protein